MTRDDRLEDGNVPLAQREGLLGSTPQEGGDATKDTEADKLGGELGAGNRQRITTGATPETAGAGEGLDEDTANLGSEIQRTDGA